MQQAQRIFVRMSEIEKIHVRGANQARLEFLGDTSFRSYLPDLTFEERAVVMQEIQALCALETAERSVHPGFPRGWAF